MDNTNDTKVIVREVIPLIIVNAMHNNEHADFITCKHCGKRGPVIAPGDTYELQRDGICIKCLTSQSKAA